ncbi:hypothetical protein Shyhy01_26040 [Streptomyces hygroscopicus subsp. hygroscopicus]|nr:hypothetical protein [Streptomyces hygroscopicus]GLX49654.1 hypothetical protein Shyhy01_26040 [Streptomyces hygroscopicus subsp. hygroscopicus]
MTCAAVEVFRRTGWGRCAGVRCWPAGLRLPFVVHEVVDDPVAAQRPAGLGVATLPVVPTAAHVARRAEGRDPGDGAALPAPVPIFPPVVLAAAHHPGPPPPPPP